MVLFVVHFFLLWQYVIGTQSGGKYSTVLDLEIDRKMTAVYLQSRLQYCEHLDACGHLQKQTFKNIG